jgi:hypothetical protein
LRESDCAGRGTIIGTLIGATPSQLDNALTKERSAE